MPCHAKRVVGELIWSARKVDGLWEYMLNHVDIIDIRQPKHNTHVVFGPLRWPLIEEMLK